MLVFFKLLKIMLPRNARVYIASLNKIYPVKGQLTFTLLNSKKDKLDHRHLIHINKFVGKDSNVLKNLR